MPASNQPSIRLPARSMIVAIPEFHTSLIRACGSRWMVDICERLFDHAERYRNLSRKMAIMPREDEHKRIVDATLARNAEKAVELLKRHVAITADIILR